MIFILLLSFHITSYEVPWQTVSGFAPAVVSHYCRIYDARHEKTDLKVCFVVIPIEGSFFWYDTDFSRI